MVKTSQAAPVALVVALLSSACAPVRVSLKPEFWQQRSVKIGVALAPHPEVGAHKVGAQGLLDMAINAGMASELKAHLKTVDVNAFDEVRSSFVQEMTKRGMQVKGLSDLVKPEEYPETQGERTSEVYPRNLSALAQKHDIDLLVLLSIRRYGTIRSYYGFIPLGAPKAFFEVQGQMVNLKTSELLWQATEDEGRASVAAADPWDQPPGYPNLTAALRTAVDAGKAYLQKEFFATGAGGT